MIGFDIIDELEYEVLDDMVRFQIENVSTGWICRNDSFTQRIQLENINRAFPVGHLKKEIEIKNILDEGTRFLKSEKYADAVKCFDDVLFYDPDYIEALINKSHALFGQRHFVKALRFYKKAVGAGFAGDVEYYKSLLAESGRERDGFPKIKLDIYAGEEYFAQGDFENALESYEKALAIPSKFRDKILFKLLNKKATTLVKLNEFESALVCFNESLNAFNSDVAVFGRGLCEYMLGLQISEAFLSELKISKRLTLKKADILNETGDHENALKCYDFLLENHFRVDEMYIEILNGKRDALLNLGLDTSKVDAVLRIIR
jgi:tetratricopeptide (TPR) repeat protein